MGLNVRFSNARGVHFLCLERYHDTIDDTQTPSAIIWNKRVWVCTSMDGICPSDGPSKIAGFKPQLVGHAKISASI